MTLTARGGSTRMASSAPTVWTVPTAFNSPVSSIYGSYYGAYAISRNGIVGQFEHEIGDKIDNSYGPFPVIENGTNDAFINNFIWKYIWR